MREGWRLAVGMLTVIRVAPPRTVDRDVARAAMLLAPLAVLPLGVAVAVVGAAAQAVGVTPLVTGFLCVGTLVLGTRAFHVDGLSDTVDGLTASYDRERSLAVMRTGTSGPAGGAAVLLVLGLQVAASASIVTSARGAVMVGVLVCASRCALLLTCAAGVPGARTGGLGGDYVGSVPRAAAVLGWVLVTVVVAGLVVWVDGDWWRALVAVAVAVGAVLVLVRRAVLRFGGVTGDVFGAAIEVCLAALLVAPRMSRALSRAIGLALGVVADHVVADPRRFHPVAGFGSLAAGLESRWYAPTRARGVLHHGVLVGGAVALGLVLEWLGARRPVLQVLVTASSTWVVLGGSSLDREGRAVSALMEQGRLPEARQRLTHLVGRDTRSLDADEIARAVVESVAENTSDAVVAPLVLGALAGVPGLLGYRAANTLDAMVGHRDERYREFGWASARLDDLLNLPGARLTALLAAALGPDPLGALATWRRDAAGHPSPNAGPVEASFAGALGVRLGGSNTYGDRVEHRQVLGSGRAPAPSDVARALHMARRVDDAAAVVAVLLALAGGVRRRGGGPVPI